MKANKISALCPEFFADAILNRVKGGYDLWVIDRFWGRTKIINVRNQNLPKHSELDCFVQLALHLGRSITSEIFVAYLQGGQNQATAADY